MINFVKVVFIAFASSTLSLASYAQDGMGYFGFGVGQATNDACDEQPTGTSCSDSKTVGRLVGGYEFNENIAIEGAYTSLGEAEVVALSGPGRAKIDGSAFSLAIVGNIQMSNNWGLYGKFGMSRWDAEASLTDGFGDSYAADDDGTDPVYGLGVKWVDGKYSIRFEYERYELGLADSIDGFFNDQDVDIVSLTYVIGF